MVLLQQHWRNPDGIWVYPSIGEGLEALEDLEALETMEDLENMEDLEDLEAMGDLEDLEEALFCTVE